MNYRGFRFTKMRNGLTLAEPQEIGRSWPYGDLEMPEQECKDTIDSWYTDRARGEPDTEDHNWS